jgi:hypothetical protein
MLYFPKNKTPEINIHGNKLKYVEIFIYFIVFQYTT